MVDAVLQGCYLIACVLLAFSMIDEIKQFCILDGMSACRMFFESLWASSSFSFSPLLLFFIYYCFNEQRLSRRITRYTIMDDMTHASMTYDLQ